MRSTVEGSLGLRLAASFAFPDDQMNDSLNIFENLPCWDSQGLDHLDGKPFVTPYVSLRIGAHSMNFAIDLNGEARRRAVEVQHIRTERMLSAEFEAARTHSQYRP